jgi:hypothetical protein
MVDSHHVVRHLSTRAEPDWISAQVLVQILLLAVHVSADGPARQPATHRADDRARRAILLVRHGTDDGTSCSADDGACFHVGHTALAAGAAIARATRDHQRQDCDRCCIPLHAPSIRIGLL